MSKKNFVADYQINASKKIIYPYLTTASGLQEWFADEVRIDEDKNFIFYFDQEDHYARQTILKANVHIRWDFFDQKDVTKSTDSVIDFILIETELTNSLYLRVIDQSNFYEFDELEGIWEGLITSLKQIIGG